MSDRAAAESSIAARTVEDLHRAIQRGIETSQIWRWFDTTGDRFGAWAREASSADALETVEQWVRASWGYRWLTKEPDPEVIVIDLQETWTVGPILAVLDRVITWAERRWRGSTLQNVTIDAGQSFQNAPVRSAGLVTLVALAVNTLVSAVLGKLGAGALGARLVVLGFVVLALRVNASWDELQESRVVALLRAIFEPPKLPEEPE